MTMWFDTIVESAIAAIMTIDVAEEKPPRKANSASAFCPSAKGTVRTNRSGLEPSGKIDCPAIAMGSTNRLIKNR